MSITVFTTGGHSRRRLNLGEMHLWLAQPAQGYFVDIARRDARFGHTLCGPNRDTGAVCPNCARPYTLYLTLDTRDDRLHLDHLPFPALPLYYCWSCNGRMMWYRLREDGAVGERWPTHGEPNPDHPYWPYPAAFPAAPVSLRRLTAEQQDLLRQLNAKDLLVHIQPHYEFLERPMHQVGGEPLMVQRYTGYEIACPVCAQPMPFLFSAGNDNTDPRGFADNELVQTVFHLCPTCATIAVYTEYD